MVSAFEQTLTIESFSGEPCFYPIRDWVNARPMDRRVLFKLTTRMPDRSVWAVEWFSERGFGQTFASESFADVCNEFWKQVTR
jgi:hypothetical protein